MKNFNDLARELSQENSANDIKDIVSQFKEVQKCLENRSFIGFTAKKAIGEWNKQEIKHWRKWLRNDALQCDDKEQQKKTKKERFEQIKYEALAVVIALCN
jgi:hypothetical protein